MEEQVNLIANKVHGLQSRQTYIDYAEAIARSGLNDLVAPGTISELGTVLEILENTDTFELTEFHRKLEEMRSSIASVNAEKYLLSLEEYVTKKTVHNPLWDNHCLKTQDAISDAKIIAEYLSSDAHQKRGLE